MQKKDFLGEIFEVMNISGDEQSKIRDKFEKLLSINLFEVFLGEISEDQKNDFKDFLKKNIIDKEKITEWFKCQNITITNELKERINNIIRKTTDEFMEILLKNINDEEKEKLLNLLER